MLYDHLTRAPRRDRPAWLGRGTALALTLAASLAAVPSQPDGAADETLFVSTASGGSP